MSIIYNGKTVANKYNLTPLTPSSEKNAGAIKIATEDELLSGSNDTAVTPYLLNKTLSKSAFCELGDIGVAPLGINESLNLRRYLNGQTISQEQFEGFTTWLKSRVELYPTLSCTNGEYESICNLSTYNQCGKFVIDNENKTIRLPKIVNIQGLQELNNNIGNTISAGLPNITGVIGATGQSGAGYGVFYKPANSGAFGVVGSPAQYSVGNGSATNSRYINADFDASRVSSVYGKSDTVQPEAIQYPYYIQVATGVKENIDITRDLELNNPYSLGESKYSEIGLNNASWLKSEGQYSSKILYPSMYEWVLKNYNKTVVVDGVSVRLNTESYTDYDYVLNLNDETFRLPLLNGKEDLPSDDKISLNILPSDSTYTAPQNGWYSFVVISSVANGMVNLYCEETGLGQLMNANATQPMRGSIPVSKGDVVHYIYPSNSMNLLFFTPAKGDGSLYYYIGDTIQDANIINAGSVINDVNNLKRNTLNTSQITNCITEIPQDIKLELKDGVLTLKAGSKVYVPNGFEADGMTPKFDEIIVENDVVRNIRTGTENNPALIFYKPSEQIMDIYDIDRSVSGNTDILATSTYHAWYDTNNNLCKIIKDNLSSYALFSLPIALCTRTNGNISSIDQVFNGFGYIGSTVYVLPNVKGLIPNGRNKDGTLKNIEAISTKLSNITFTEDIKNIYFGFSTKSNMEINGAYSYDELKNFVYNKSNIAKYVPCGKYDIANGKITNFQLYKPFRALNYSDSSAVSGWSFPSNKYIDLTLGASGTTYTAPSNGWFVSRQQYNEGYYEVSVGHITLVETNTSNTQLSFLIPVKKGWKLTYHYSNLQNGTTFSYFRFIYAEGEV